MGQGGADAEGPAVCPDERDGVPGAFTARGGELPLSTSAQLALLRGVVTEGGRALRMRARGLSMTPFIRDGDVVTLAPVDSPPANVGEVVAAEIPPGRLVIHRIVGRVAGGGWRLRGDNCPLADGTVSDEGVLGRVVRVERGGRSVRFGQGAGRVPIALLSDRGVFRAIAALVWVPRRFAAAGLGRAQGLRWYRSVGRRLAPHVETAPAARVDLAILGHRQDLEGSHPAGFGPGVATWTARIRGRVVGFVQLVDDPDPGSGWAGCWLFSLLVAGRWRGLGVGETLVRHAIEQARARGASELLLAVWEDDERARGLYTKLGFYPTVLDDMEPGFEAERRLCGRRRIVMRRRFDAPQ